MGAGGGAEEAGGGAEEAGGGGAAGWMRWRMTLTFSSNCGKEGYEGT